MLLRRVGTKSTGGARAKRATAVALSVALALHGTLPIQALPELPLGLTSHAIDHVREPTIIGLAGFTLVGTQTASATSLTVPAHLPGDVIIIWAMRGSSTVAPTRPSGYLQVASNSNSTATTLVGISGYRIANATNDASGTWTNASELICAVYRPSTGYIARVGQNSTSSSTTATVTFPALSPLADSTSANSWVIGLVAASNTTQALTTAPTGMTNRTSVVGASFQAALHDTNGGVSSWTAATANVTSTGSTVCETIELVLAPIADPLANNVYQHVAGGGNDSADNQAGNTFVCPLPKPSGAGNTYVVWMTCTGAATVSSVTGTVNGSLGSAAGSALGGTGNLDSYVYVLPNITAGQEEITFVFSATVASFQYIITEFYGVATTFTATAGSTVQTTANSLTIGTGSFTPPNNDSTGGNLVYSYFIKAVQNPNGNTTRIFPGANFTLRNADIGWNATGSNAAFSMPKAVQGYIQTTHAAINPAIVTVAPDPAGGDQWNSLAIALKISAGTGTPPSSKIDFNSIHHFVSDTAFPTTGTYVLQGSFTGNCRVAQCDDANLNALTVTDSEGNTWDPTAAAAGFWLCPNTRPNPNLEVYITGGGADANVSWRLIDVGNAAPLPFDSFVTSGQSLNGLTSFTASPAPNPVLAAGLVIAAIGLGQGPGLAVTAPANAVWDMCTYTGEADTDKIENADILAHARYTVLGSQTWTFTITNIASNSSSGGFLVLREATQLGWAPRAYPRVGWPRLSPRYGKYTAELMQPRRGFATGSGPQTFLQTLTASQAEAATLGPNQIGVTRTVTQSEALLLAKAVAHAFASIPQATVATLVNSVAHIFGAIAQATSASLAAGRLFARTLTASIASTATLARAVSLVRSVSQATVATLARAVAIGRSASQASAAALVKQVGVNRALSQATAATLVKAVSKKLASATQATVATLTAIKVHLLTLTATQATTATLTKAVAIVRTVGQASTAIRALAVRTTLAPATQASSAALVKVVSLTRSLTQATVATLVHGLLKFVTLTASQATTAVLVKQAQLVRSAAQATTVSMRRTVGVVRTISQAAAASFGPRFLTVTRVVAQPTVATLVRLIALTRSVAQATAAVLTSVFQPRPSGLASEAIILAYTDGRLFMRDDEGKLFVSYDDGTIYVDLG